MSANEGYSLNPRWRLQRFWEAKVIYIEKMPLSLRKEEMEGKSKGHGDVANRGKSHTSHDTAKSNSVIGNLCRLLL